MLVISKHPTLPKQGGSSVVTTDLAVTCHPHRRPEHDGVGNRLVVRSTDGTGASQVAKDRASGPEGATRLHRVMARIA